MRIAFRQGFALASRLDPACFKISLQRFAKNILRRPAVVLKPRRWRKCRRVVNCGRRPPTPLVTSFGDSRLGSPMVASDWPASERGGFSARSSCNAREVAQVLSFAAEASERTQADWMASSGMPVPLGRPRDQGRRGS